MNKLCGLTLLSILSAVSITPNVYASNSNTDIEFHVMPLFQMDLRKSWAQTYQVHLQEDANISTQYKTARSIDKLIHNIKTSPQKLVLSNKHVARYLKEELGFVPISQHAYDIAWVLVSAQQNTIPPAAPIEKYCVATPRKLDKTTLEIKKELGHKKYFYKDVITQDNVLLSLLKGECDLGVVSNRLFERVNPSQKDIFKIIKQGDMSKKLLVFSVSKNMDKKTILSLQKSLLKIGHSNHKNFFREDSTTPPAELPPTFETKDPLYQAFIDQLKDLQSQ